LNADCVDFGDSKCRIGGRGSTQTVRVQMV
jgi:hypothetical protein